MKTLLELLLVGTPCLASTSKWCFFLPGEVSKCHSDRRPCVLEHRGFLSFCEAKAFLWPLRKCQLNLWTLLTTYGQIGRRKRFALSHCLGCAVFCVPVLLLNLHWKCGLSMFCIQGALLDAHRHWESKFKNKCLPRTRWPQFCIPFFNRTESGRDFTERINVPCLPPSWLSQSKNKIGAFQIVSGTRDAHGLRCLEGTKWENYKSL